jgi:hypothetical protein
MSTAKPITFTIFGEPASKANSRKIVTNPRTGKTMVIKSQKARTYTNDFSMQCPQLEQPLACDVSVTATIYYATRRPDLDESVILDCMQSLKGRDKKIVRNNIYANDRQVKEKHIYWGLDKENPRAEICVEPLTRD